MGSMLTQPVTNKMSDEGKGLGLRYGLCSMQGWRPEMEDAHDVKIGLRYGLDKWSFFAVFDGHAGKCAAAYAACNLLDYILKDSEFDLEIDQEIQDTATNNNVSSPDTSVSAEIKSNGSNSTNTLEHTDENIKNAKQSLPDTNSLSETLSHPTVKDEHQHLLAKATKLTEKINDSKPKFASFPVAEQLGMVKKAIRSGYLRIDQSMRTSAQDMSGCTAVCTLISPTHLFIANCGDSRAVLYDGIKPRFATEDHKPFNPIERKRIIDAGGTATQRINGTLAVSRALGDFEFKKDTMRGPCEQLVSPEPEVTIIRRHQTDEFMILACDGIWDVMNNEDLCKFVRHRLMIDQSVEKVCSSVLDVCLRKGSKDNMSVIIVVFEPGPRIDEETIRTENDHDKVLLLLVDQFQDKDRSDDFESFISNFGTYLSPMHYLLPPGAGIEAKYDLLRERFEENMKKYDEQVDE